MRIGRRMAISGVRSYAAGIVWRSDHFSILIVELIFDFSK